VLNPIYYFELSHRSKRGKAKELTHSLTHSGMSSVGRISLCYSNFVKPNVLFKTHILTILCDVFVLVNVLVIKPLLCMHIDNISTLTSDMPSVVYTAIV